MRGDYFNSLLDTEDGVFRDRGMLMGLLKASPNEKVVSTDGADRASAAPRAAPVATLRTRFVRRRRKGRRWIDNP